MQKYNHRTFGDSIGNIFTHVVTMVSNIFQTQILTPTHSLLKLTQIRTLYCQGLCVTGAKRSSESLYRIVLAQLIEHRI